jgi:hypothetical protein
MGTVVGRNPGVGLEEEFAMEKMSTRTHPIFFEVIVNARFISLRVRKFDKM